MFGFSLRISRTAIKERVCKGRSRNVAETMTMRLEMGTSITAIRNCVSIAKSQTVEVPFRISRTAMKEREFRIAALGVAEMMTLLHRHFSNYAPCALKFCISARNG